MGFKDVFKKSFLEGFTSMDITTGKIAATLIVTALLALYIFAIYRLVTRKVFYSKNFNISLAVMSLITSAIILAMQSNLDRIGYFCRSYRIHSGAGYASGRKSTDDACSKQL